MAKLTDRFCAGAPAGEHTDDLTRDLILMVRPSTAKTRASKLRRSWVLRVTIGGKRRKIGLGAYPFVGLADARQKARDALRAIGEGKDPTRAGRARLRERTLTFGRSVDQYLNDAAPRFKNPKDEAIRTRALSVHCARFNDRPVDQISPREIAQLLKTLKPETAVKTRSALSRVFAFAAVELAQAGVVMRVPTAPDLLAAVGYAPPRAQTRGRQPAVDHRELPAVMAALAEIPTTSARCLEFIVLTASRSGAARLARFDQIDVAERVWRVPAEQMKDSSHRSGVFVVPLSRDALAVVETMREINSRRLTPSPFVFAGDDGGPLDEMRLTSLTRTLRRKGDWRDPVTRKPFVVHGFRSSFRTWVETTRRRDRDVAELAMGHKAHGAVEGRYVRDGLLEERRRLLDAWADHCMGRSGVVVALPLKRA